MTPPTSSREPRSAPRASGPEDARPVTRAARRTAAREGRPRPRTSSRVTTAVSLGAVTAVLLAGGVFLYGRIAEVQRGAVLPDIPQGMQRDPATRARGAVISISGEASHPDATYDPASGTVTVRFQSRYYDPAHTAALNRQYLATEGKLIVQLALYNDSAAAQVVAELYRGRRRLATVTGAPGQDYAAYSVQYAPGLP
jgi:hypothetical protein